MAIETVYELIE